MKEVELKTYVFEFDNKTVIIELPVELDDDICNYIVLSELKHQGFIYTNLA